MQDRKGAKMEVYIYALVAPDTGEVGYVGQSIKPQHRYREHLRKGAAAGVASWVTAVRERGLEPQLRILETTDSVGGDEAECRHLRQYLDLGWAKANDPRYASVWEGRLKRRVRYALHRLLPEFSAGRALLTGATATVVALRYPDRVTWRGFDDYGLARQECNQFEREGFTTERWYGVRDRSVFWVARLDEWSGIGGSEVLALPVAPSLASQPVFMAGEDNPHAI
jgi:hypothetical protein